ncbi:hypothetical protein MBANPS3_004358 [Mucor bainieri]
MKSLLQYVFLSSTCPICEREFSRKANLRKHLKAYELLDLAEPFTLNRVHSTKYIKVVTQAQRKTRTNFSIRFACPCCRDYFEELEALGDHLTDVHLPSPTSKNMQELVHLVDTL